MLEKEYCAYKIEITRQYLQITIAFTALTLLVGWQQGPVETTASKPFDILPWWLFSSNYLWVLFNLSCDDA